MKVKNKMFHLKKHGIQSIKTVAEFADDFGNGIKYLVIDDNTKHMMSGMLITESDVESFLDVNPDFHNDNNSLEYDWSELGIPQSSQTDIMTIFYVEEVNLFFVVIN